MAEAWSYLVVGVAVGALLAVGLATALTRAARRRRRARRFGRSAALEAEAAQWLAARGYELLASQARGSGTLLVDGEPRPFECQVDYLVQRAGRVYAVEVKSGQRAPNPLHRATRRQLREYAAVFDVDGLLLLDMERYHLQSIAFPSPAQACPSALLAAGVGLVGGVLLALAAYLWTR